MTKGFVYSFSAALGMAMESGPLVMALTVQGTSRTLAGEAMALKITEVNSNTTAYRRLWKFVSMVGILVLVWVLEVLYLIELPGVLVERCDLNTKHPVRIPSGFGNKSDESTSTDDGAIAEGHMVLVAPEGAPNKYAIFPFLVQLASQFARDEPENFLSKFANVFSGLDTVQAAPCCMAVSAQRIFVQQVPRMVHNPAEQWVLAGNWNLNPGLSC